MSKVIQKIICNTISEKLECVENLKQLGHIPDKSVDELLNVEGFWAIRMHEDNTFTIHDVEESFGDINPSITYKEWKQRMINERGTLPYSEPTLQELLDKFTQDMRNRGYKAGVNLKAFDKKVIVYA